MYAFACLRIQHPQIVGLLVEIDLDHHHTLGVGRENGLVVHVPRSDLVQLVALAVVYGELTGVGLKDLGDDLGAFYGIPRKLGRSGTRNQQSDGQDSRRGHDRCPARIRHGKIFRTAFDDRTITAIDVRAQDR